MADNYTYSFDLTPYMDQPEARPEGLFGKSTKDKVEESKSMYQEMADMLKAYWSGTDSTPEFKPFSPSVDDDVEISIYEQYSDVSPVYAEGIMESLNDAAVFSDVTPSNIEKYGDPLGAGVVTAVDGVPVVPEEPVVESALDNTEGVQTEPDATQELLDRIAFGEGADPSKLQAQEKHGIGTTPYDMVYNYGNTLAPSKPVTEMTMQELYDYQTDLIAATKGQIPGTNSGTSAAGKYQVIRKSLFGSGTPDAPMKNSWADKLGLKADTVYTPEIQEEIGMLALKEAGYNSFIRGGRSRNSFHNKIANIWASVARSDGSDTYGQGIHTNLSDLQPMYDLLKPTKPEPLETSLRPVSRPRGLMSQ